MLKCLDTDIQCVAKLRMPKNFCMGTYYLENQKRNSNAVPAPIIGSFPIRYADDEKS